MGQAHCHNRPTATTGPLPQQAHCHIQITTTKLVGRRPLRCDGEPSHAGPIGGDLDSVGEPSHAGPIGGGKSNSASVSRVSYPMYERINYPRVHSRGARACWSNTCAHCTHIYIHVPTARTNKSTKLLRRGHQICHFQGPVAIGPLPPAHE